MKYDLIFLLDDFDVVNFLHRILFRQLGLEERVKVSTCPKDILNELRARNGEDLRILILLDINMPEMNGFEFLEHLEKDFFTYSIDVIIVTSSVSDSDMVLAKEYPRYVRNFVSKPLQLEKLKFLLKSANEIHETNLP